MVHTQILVGAQNKVFWHSVADRFNQRFYSFVRGAGYNTHHISWDCSGTLNVGFCELACQKQKKKSTRGGQEHKFLSEYGYSIGCPNLLWLTMTLPETNKKLMRKASGIVGVVVRD